MAIPTTKKKREFHDPEPESESGGLFWLHVLKVKHQMIWMAIIILAVYNLVPYIFDETVPLSIKMDVMIIFTVLLGVNTLLLEPGWRSLVENEIRKKEEENKNQVENQDQGAEKK